MADNVTVPNTSVSDIATDQVTTTLEHVQLFKLAYGTDGIRTLVPADQNGLRVSVVQADVERVWQHTMDNLWSSADPWEMRNPYV